MTSDKSRLRRAQLIERVRSAEQRKAATEAHRAEAVRVKLEQLSERTRSLAQLYVMRDTAEDAAELRGAAILGAHLRELGQAHVRFAACLVGLARGFVAELAQVCAEDRRAAQLRGVFRRVAQGVELGERACPFGELLELHAHGFGAIRLGGGLALLGRADALDQPRTAQA